MDMFDDSFLSSTFEDIIRRFGFLIIDVMIKSRTKHEIHWRGFLS